MARTIRSSDQFKDKLYKLIPSEIVVAWMALKGLFETLPHLPSVILILWTLLIPVLITMPTQKKKQAKSEV